jgi:hypothetical protein
VARKARRSRRLEPVQGSNSRPESARRVCGGSPQNRRVTWLSYETKIEGSAGGDGIRSRVRSFNARGHAKGSLGLHREDADWGKGVAVR